MAINPSQAISAYQNVAKQAQNGVAGGDGTRSADGSSFAELLGKATESGVESLRASEAASINGITGKADLTDVVTAVNNAEITLQAIVAIRDRVMQAYQQIMRMPM